MNLYFPLQLLHRSQYQRRPDGGIRHPVSQPTSAGHMARQKDEPRFYDGHQDLFLSALYSMAVWPIQGWLN